MRPRTDRVELEKYHEGLIIASACLGGEIPQKIMHGTPEEVEEAILWYKNIFGEDYYLEMQRHKATVPNAKIYVLQGIGEDSLASFERSNLIPVIAGREQLAFWKEHKIKGIKPAIQIETGLNRLGFRENELTEMSPDDRDLFSLVLSHLACADEQGHFMNEYQLQNFNRLRERFFPRLPASLSASDGTFLGQDYRFDVVRLGAAMYGINTAPYRENQMLPVVRVMAPVLEISALSRGDFVGYSATYRAAGNRKIAIVSIGYGDGVPRALSNVGKLFFYNGGESQNHRTHFHGQRHLRRYRSGKPACRRHGFYRQRILHS